MRVDIGTGLVALLAACGGTVGGDSNASDSGKDTTSVDVVVDVDAGDGACPAPASVQGFTPSPMHPARIEKGSCTSTQIDDYFKNCIAPSSGCDAFVAANASCVACLVSPSSDPTWGPLVTVDGGKSNSFNGTGCIVAVTGDSSATSCAQKYNDVNQCAEAACTAQCPLDTPQDIPLFEQCTSDARSTVCASFVAAECAADAGFYTQCIASGSNDPESSFDAIAGAMCGP